MSNHTNSIFNIATEYLEKGYSIIPCGKNKRPLIQWREFQTRQATEDELLQWLKQWPEMNIGIVTGQISGITVLDLDVGHETSTPITAFPLTLTHKTPSGGIHLIYQYTPGLTVSSNAYPQFPYTDVRSDSGFIVAPPSQTEAGGYEVLHDFPISPFPAHLFPKTKPKKTLTEMTTASKGNRNDTLASFAGKLLQASVESEWINEVLPAVQRANLTYTPKLSDQEVLTVFNSIAKKEKQNREGLIVSPFQTEDGEEVPATKIKLRKNSANVPYKDMANVVLVLETHPFYKDTIKYNTFRLEIEYNGKPLEDSDLAKIQYFMQCKAGLPGISKDAVFAAMVHYAQQHCYDEAQDWLKNLVWDGEPRVKSWLTSATGVPDDVYHQGIGMQWFNGMVSRIMHPGCIFDYLLVITGPQGLGKTSLFRIIGGPFYKSYTGAVDNKDFYLALRGAIIIDLDEGATLYKSEAIKIKSIISDTHDEFRAPYERLLKKYPRRFVFSMSTNDSEPFRDVTGNRRYWAIDIKRGVDFKWLEDNRGQLFAEAYHYYKNKMPIAEVPMDEARAIQEAHLPDDSWTQIVVNEIRRSHNYCTGDPNYSTTIMEVFAKVFPDESLMRLDRKHEMRIGTIFKKELGLEKRREMIDGERKTRWYICDEKLKELQQNEAQQIVDDFDKLTEEDI